MMNEEIPLLDHDDLRRRVPVVSTVSPPGPFGPRGPPHSVEEEEDDELRIVLVGKTGVGKSSSGNTILNEDVFEAQLSPSTVTERCQKASRTIDGRRITIIDTPGLFDTEVPNGEIMTELVRSISMMAPGPHVFLVVMQLGRVTQEEIETVELIKELFGDEASRYTMVLFTWADGLIGKDRKVKTLEEFFHGKKKGSSYLRDILKFYRNNYHSFNNKNMDDLTQVAELLEKIDTIVKMNNGGFYTNVMLQKAQKAIKEKEGEILNERKEAIHIMERQLSLCYEGEELEVRIKQLWIEEHRLAREQAEKDNSFTEYMLIILGIVVLTATAGVVGAAIAGGPVVLGVAAAAAGGGMGAFAGLGAFASKIKRTTPRCSVQ